MKLGFQIYSFTWPGGPEAIGPTLARSVRTADDVGFDSIWVMDHFWQIGAARLGAPADARGLDDARVHGRPQPAGPPRTDGRRRPLPQPGLWVKAATTLDVLSGGRAWLGIGAAWNQAESEGLGFPFPPLAERFEMLEDTLRIAHGMWQGERGSEEDFVGRSSMRRGS